MKKPTKRELVTMLKEGRVKEFNKKRPEKLNLRKIKLNNRYLENVNFENADLANANFDNSYLRGCNFNRAYLKNASLQDDILNGVNFIGANLEGANLCNSFIRDANLSKADFTHANLENVNFSGSNLRYVMFRAANLAFTDLTNTDLRGANLDFVSLPLWCGGLNYKIDIKAARQILYLILNLMIHSGIKIPETDKKLLKFANKFHWIGCHNIKELVLPEKQLKQKKSEG